MKKTSSEKIPIPINVIDEIIERVIIKFLCNLSLRKRDIGMRTNNNPIPLIIAAELKRYFAITSSSTSSLSSHTLQS